MMADCEAVNGRKNFIILILKDKLPMKGLRRDVKTYLQAHTYIDGTKHPEQIPQRLRYVCRTMQNGVVQTKKKSFLCHICFSNLRNTFRIKKNRVLT